jgi:hypothetical protein
MGDRPTLTARGRDGHRGRSVEDRTSGTRPGAANDTGLHGILLVPGLRFGPMLDRAAREGNGGDSGAGRD